METTGREKKSAESPREPVTALFYIRKGQNEVLLDEIRQKRHIILKSDPIYYLPKTWSGMLAPLLHSFLEIVSRWGMKL